MTTKIKNQGIHEGAAYEFASAPILYNDKDAVLCDACDGSGAAADWTDCQACNGEGTISSKKAAR